MQSFFKNKMIAMLIPTALFRDLSKAHKTNILGGHVYVEIIIINRSKRELEISNNPYSVFYSLINIAVRN